MHGWCNYLADPGESVALGQLIAEITGYDGARKELMLAPVDGVVLWRCTHRLIEAQSDLFGIGA